MCNGNKGTEEIFETMTENFPKLMSDTEQFQQAQRTLHRINTK